MNSTAISTDISQMLERLRLIRNLEEKRVDNSEPVSVQQLQDEIATAFCQVYDEEFVASRFSFSSETKLFFENFSGMLTGNGFRLFGSTMLEDNIVAAQGSFWIRIAVQDESYEFYLCCDTKHPMFGCIVEAGYDRPLPEVHVRPDSPERTERIWIGILDFLYDNSDMYRNWQEEEVRVMDRKKTENTISFPMPVHLN